MGYIRHHAIIVTSWNEERISEAHSEATKLFNHVSGVVESPINDYYSFLIAPDGGKEGWEDSEKGDKSREEFKKWIISQAYSDGSNTLDFVEVFYGDDNGAAGVVSHN